MILFEFVAFDFTGGRKEKKSYICAIKNACSQYTEK